MGFRTVWRSVAAAVITAAVLPMTVSCGSAATCASFIADLAPDAHDGQATPLQAVLHYAHDALGYPDDPKAWTTATTTTVTTASGPGSGDRRVGDDAKTGTRHTHSTPAVTDGMTGGVTLRADHARLHVAQLSDGTWLVDGGQNC